MKLGRKQCTFVGAVAVWAAAAGGLALLTAGSFVPTEAAAAQPGWPHGIALPRRGGEPTLVLCLHPRCPCSDATLDEWIELIGSATDADAHVLFAVPPDAGPEWTDTPLIARARGVVGLDVRIDEGGRLAAALGAKSSGQTFLYDADGRLVFAGGLTVGRGERGPNTGMSLLKDAMANRGLPPTPVRTAVFGCRLCLPPAAAHRPVETR